MKIRIQVLCLVTLLLSGFSGYAQKKQIAKFETRIALAVKKAYPASVRIWGFDVKQNERTSAQFSGVVVSKDGYILTAAHTVYPGRNYKVFFPDGRECIAMALGRIDKKDTPGIPDVGMMKIVDKGDWPFAEMGYSSSLVVNEPCISISYPETLNQNLPTLRLGRIAEVKNTYGFIRSTCKMEPGDSGGPLFDYMGRVIGLHSAIDVQEDQNFEIPVDLYRKYWTALNSQTDYNTLPEQVDVLQADTLKDLILRENRGRLLNPRLIIADGNNKKSYSITSKIGDKSQSIAATLINLKEPIAGFKQILISKNTMIGTDPLLWVGEKQVKLAILKKDQDNDLIILGTTENIKGGIALGKVSDSSTKLEMGKLLYTGKPDGTVMHGILSSSLFDLPKITSQAFLGAMVVYRSSPIQFSLIKPDSPAEKGGLKVGDELLSINGKALTQSTEFASELMQFWPGDRVNFVWMSDGKRKSANIELISRPTGISNHPAEKFAGGKSERRDGFKQVFPHDIAITPSECGTPVFDRNGEFVGINIARFSRAATICIPAQVVCNTILSLRNMQSRAL